SEGKKKDEERKAADAKKKEAEKAEAEKKKREAQHKAELARKAAEAKRRAAAMAAEEARRAAERRQADEADMLARARREAEEMRAAEEEARLTEEARRLIEQAERERAKAEELLAGQPKAEQRVATPAEPEPPGGAEDARLAYQRAEETRRLAEKLRRVRQIHEARVAAQARREAEAAHAAAAAPATPASPQPSEAAQPDVATGQPMPSPEAPKRAEAAPQPVVAVPMPVASPPPPPAAEASPPPARPQAVAAAPASPPPSVVETPAKPRPATEGNAPGPAQPRPTLTERNGLSVPADAPAATAAKAGGYVPTRFTVLLVLEPGTYGIRKNGPKVADPVLCMHEGCYVSAGADRPAVYMRGHKALGFGNTWGGRAGACRQALGCVFRDVDLGPLPGYLQPVDLHIFKHDRRPGQLVLADSGCRADSGRLLCRHGIYAETYTLWVLPESVATEAGPAALQRAVSEGLNGPRSAALAPR